ncbi:MAG: GDCCVxC domain-containing (seleno)protein [Thermoplasmata archaeon]
MILDSKITCPKCGYSTVERMPIDQCLIRYQCPRCGFVMTPKQGDCCVFCSYGSVPCPPVQEARDSCCAKKE